MIDFFGIKANKELNYCQHKLIEACDLLEQLDAIIKTQSAKIAMLESQSELSQFTEIDFPNSKKGGECMKITCMVCGHSFIRTAEEFKKGGSV